MGSQGCVGTGSGHHLCPRSPGPALGLGFSTLATQEPTSLWKNFTEQGWGGKQMISCFLMTPSPESPPVPPGGWARRPCTAPQRGRRGASLGRGPCTGVKVQGQTGTGTGCSGPGSAEALSCSPRHLCGYLLLPGSLGHLQPHSVLWEGVRMQMGDAQAQELRHPHTSRSRLGSLPVSAGSAVRGQEFAESLSGGSWSRQCHPGLAPARCSGYRSRAVLALCKQRRDGAGGGCSQFRQPRNLLARHRPAPTLLEPGPIPWPCADGYRGWPGSGGSTTPQSTVWSQSLCLSPFPAADPDQQHNNHNRVRLWGSWACPRVSGLRSHSLSYL